MLLQYEYQQWKNKNIKLVQQNSIAIVQFIEKSTTNLNKLHSGGQNEFNIKIEDMGLAIFHYSFRFMDNYHSL